MFADYRRDVIQVGAVRHCHELDARPCAKVDNRNIVNVFEFCMRRLFSFQGRLFSVLKPAGMSKDLMVTSTWAYMGMHECDVTYLQGVWTRSKVKKMQGANVFILQIGEGPSKLCELLLEAGKYIYGPVRPPWTHS